MSSQIDRIEQFERQRSRLRAIAAGILGSVHDADDAVQEAWMRLARGASGDIQNFDAWSTVVVSRIALDQVRARTRRRETSYDPASPIQASHSTEPESVVLGDAEVVEALSIALDRLSPLEAAAFILHDLFQMPFDDIAEVMGRSPTATRQLASRARRKVAAGGPLPGESAADHRAIIDAFFRAAREGDLQTLVSLLAPGAVLRADRTSVERGIPAEIRGDTDIARQLAGRAQAARLAWIDGDPGAIWSYRAAAAAVFRFEVRSGRIEVIELHADTAYLAQVDIELEPAERRRRAGARLRSGPELPSN